MKELPGSECLAGQFLEVRGLGARSIVCILLSLLNREPALCGVGGKVFFGELTGHELVDACAHFGVVIDTLVPIVRVAGNLDAEGEEILLGFIKGNMSESGNVYLSKHLPQSYPCQDVAMTLQPEHLRDLLPVSPFRPHPREADAFCLPVKAPQLILGKAPAPRTKLGLVIDDCGGEFPTHVQY